MKYLPNCITIFRIACALALLAVPPLSPAFWALYLLGGASDLLDGFAARKLHLCSAAGATLDSAADTVFALVLLVRLLPLFAPPPWVWHWIFAIAAVRMVTLLLGFFKYRTLAFLHTTANKIAGLALFLLPVLHRLLGITITAILLCALTSFSALEELAITCTAQEFNADRRSIFNIFKNNR